MIYELPSSAWPALTKAEAEKVWDSMSGAEKDVLLQLRRVHWDGYIASKSGRDSLIDAGYAHRYEGFTTITSKGLKVLYGIGRLESLTCGKLTASGFC